ncbi:unnamed protein product [Ostreobium quekettii]|uniref:Uncharacterized protein n=1 Tax=Ostreobium quekettii TaxID=121088 RepID=A0A8S1JB65_9CHLO|nr:unnamed protein product [Ostreobium quekettii]
MHPNYRPGHLRDGYDIAVLILSDPVEGIPIPQLADPHLFLHCKMTALTLGWGSQHSTGGDLPEKLQMGTHSILFWDSSSCPVDSSLLMCLKAPPPYEENTCAGDSGGPVLVPDMPGFVFEEGNPERDLIVGLTSFGTKQYDCSHPKSIGYYTRLSTMRDWIDETVEAELGSRSPSPAESSIRMIPGSEHELRGLFEQNWILRRTSIVQGSIILRGMNWTDIESSKENQAVLMRAIVTMIARQAEVVDNRVIITALTEVRGNVGINYKVIFPSPWGRTDTSPTGDFGIDNFLLGISMRNETFLMQYDPDENSLSRMQLFSDVRLEQAFSAEPIKQEDLGETVLWKKWVSQPEAVAGAMLVLCLAIACMIVRTGSSTTNGHSFSFQGHGGSVIQGQVRLAKGNFDYYKANPELRKQISEEMVQALLLEMEQHCGTSNVRETGARRGSIIVSYEIDIPAGTSDETVRKLVDKLENNASAVFQKSKLLDRLDPQDCNPVKLLRNGIQTETISDCVSTCTKSRGTASTFRLFNVLYAAIFAAAFTVALTQVVFTKPTVSSVFQLAPRMEKRWNETSEWRTLGAASQLSTQEGVVDAPAGRFDYIVSISGVNYGHKCSGVLIEGSWVLTAAHCVESVGKLPRVHINRRETGGAGPTAGDTLKVVESIIHPKWNGNLENGWDAALLLLDRSVGVVSPILADPSFNLRPSTQLFVPAFGDSLRLAKMTVVPNHLWLGLRALSPDMSCMLSDSFPLEEGCSGGPALILHSPGGPNDLVHLQEGRPDLDLLVGIVSHSNMVQGFHRETALQKIMVIRQWIFDVVHTEDVHRHEENENLQLWSWIGDWSKGTLLLAGMMQLALVASRHLISQRALQKCRSVSKWTSDMERRESAMKVASIEPLHAVIDEVGEMLPSIRYNENTLKFLHACMEHAKIISQESPCTFHADSPKLKAWNDLVKAITDGKMLVSSHTREFDLWNYYTVSEAVYLVEDCCAHILISVEQLMRGSTASAQNKIPDGSAEEDRVFLEQHLGFLIGIRGPECIGNQSFLPEWIDIRSRIRGALDRVEQICRTDVEWESKTLIASGRQGTVYRTNWKGRPVALKVAKGMKGLDSGLGALAGLWAEAALNARFDHPHVTRVLAMSGIVRDGEVDPNAFLVMELGTENLETWYKRQDPEDWLLKRHVLFQAAKGLLHLHESRVVHRDINTQNFLVFDDGQDSWPIIKVCDFGDVVAQPICWRNETTLEKQPGTSFYLAPEIFDGEPSSTESDVFSFGMVSMEIVASKGISVLEAQWAGIRARQDARLPCKIPSGCPNDLEDLIVRCLSPNPDARPSMREVVSILAE